MPGKIMLFVFVVILFGSYCLDLTRAANETADNLVEKQKQDAEIQKILFGETPIIQECLKITERQTTSETKRNDITKSDKPLWTVVILREEIISKNKTLNIQECIGSLIHPKVVLTAAHCLYNKPITELKVRAVESNRRPDQNTAFLYQEHRIKNIVFQKAYDPTNPRRDIALVFLKSSFSIFNVKTVCLPPKNSPVNYVRCFVTGWETKTHVNLGDANFEKIDLPIVPYDRCQQVLRLTGLGEDFKLPKSYLCAGGELDKSVFEGNGGAPLVCPVCGSSDKMVQVGVMSWGFKEAPLPEVFTAVASSRGWIKKELKKNQLKLPNCGIK